MTAAPPPVRTPSALSRAALGVLVVATGLWAGGLDSEGLNLAVLVLWGGVLLCAQVVRYRRFSSDVGRQQTKRAMLGIVLGMASALVVVGFFLLPVEEGTAWDWQRRLIANTMWLGFLLIPAGVVLALLRYRLWDAEAAWSRSAMAAALVLVLTAIIAGGTALMQTALGASGPLAIGLATVVAAVFFTPLQNHLSDWADRRFLRDLTDLKAHLPDLMNHLRETESVEGWLVLGPRPDGSGYGPDDLEAVTEVAGPVGRALRVVRVWEAREASQEAALHTQETNFAMPS